MKPHRGTLILVFGILGIVTCWPLAIAAWIMGGNDLKEMDAGSMDPAGRGNTNAGRVCGIIGTLLGLLWFTLALVFLIIFMFFSVRSPGPRSVAPAARLAETVEHSLETSAPTNTVPGNPQR